MESGPRTVFGKRENKEGAGAPRVRIKGQAGPKTTWQEENKILIGLMQSGKLEEAMEQAHKLLDYVDKKYGKKDHPERATTYNNMGMVLMMQKMYDLAEEALRDALGMRRRIFGPDHREVAVVLLNLVQLYKMQANDILTDARVEASGEN
jgi:tetratricopeptide (TPR) repeat protein